MFDLGVLQGSGRRDQRITLETLTRTVGASRFPVDQATPLAQVWASRTPVGGRDRFAANQAAATADTRFEIAWRADMDPATVDVPATRRLVYQGRPYAIVWAAPIGRHRAIELLTVSKP